MSVIHTAILDEAGQRSTDLTPQELLLLVERHHEIGTPGVSHEIYDAYAEGLGETTHRWADEFTDGLTANLTTSTQWADHNAVYSLGDRRVSTYPAVCYEQLGGVTDPCEYLQYLITETNLYDQMVPEQALLDFVSAVGGIDHELATTALKSLKAKGEILTDIDRSSEKCVYLPRDTH